MEPRKPEVIVNEFNIIIGKLITKLEKKCRLEHELANLDRMRKRIKILKDLASENLLLGADLVLCKYTKEILNRDAEFVYTLDPRKVYFERYKEEPTQKQEFVFSLCDIVRNHYKKVSVAEQSAILDDLVRLYNDCVEYHAAIKAAPKKG
jgi:hypothetical protein